MSDLTTIASSDQTTINPIRVNHSLTDTQLANKIYGITLLLELAMAQLNERDHPTIPAAKHALTQIDGELAELLDCFVLEARSSRKKTIQEYLLDLRLKEVAA